MIKSDVDIDAIFEEGTPIDEAMNEAVRSAVDLHRRMELPMAIWRNGKVMWVSADEPESIEPLPSER
jgi:hypothetical protein